MFGKLFKKKPKDDAMTTVSEESAQTHLRGVYPTDSGMHCIWSPMAFSNVHDYDSWEAELLDDDDISRHIQAGNFIPINILSDGALGIEVRVGSFDVAAVLSDRERKFLLVASKPYRFVSKGALCVSGIEYVEGQPGDYVGKLSLASGEYFVTVNMINWKNEPGIRNTDGSPTADALPDFVVLANPSFPGAHDFRIELLTFPPQKAE